MTIDRRTLGLGMTALATVFLLLSGSRPALALVEVENRLEVSLPGNTPTPVFAPVWNDARSTGLSDRLGGRWTLQPNPLTGSAHLVWGSGTPMPSVAGADDATLESLARYLIAGQPLIFGLAPSQLRGTSVARVAGKSAVWFQQYHRGVPVEGARAHVLFHDSGRLMGMGSDLHPAVEVDVAPDLDRALAISLAREGLPFMTPQDEVEDCRLLIVPLPMNGGLEYRLAWRMILQSESPVGRWNVLLDARDGSVLERRNEISTLDVTGNAAGTVHWTGYCDDDVTDQPFPNMEVYLPGGNEDITDENGDFLIPHGGSSNVSIAAKLFGPWANVTRAGSSARAEFNGVATPGQPLEIYWDSGNSRADERNAFIHVNRLHDYMKALDPAFTGIDYRVTCEVDGNDFLCPGNAWWDGAGLHFCREGGGFANTGEIGNIITHEYGHIITDVLYTELGQPYPNTSISEGNSDIIGLLMDLDSVAGRGFFLNDCDSGIRDADNDLVYPDDLGGSGHANGQILSGVFWDALAELRTSHGDDEARDIVAAAWHFGRKLGAPQNFPDQVYWTFVADDDDGNLDNGTPHHAEFCLGATNHGFDCPEITDTAVAEGQAAGAAAGRLDQNSPNPFNPATTIRFALKTAGPARLAIYDARGRQVKLLADEHFAAGERELSWDGRDDAGQAQASGVYLYRLETAEGTLGKRMTLLK